MSIGEQSVYSVQFPRKLAFPDKNLSFLPHYIKTPVICLEMTLLATFTIKDIAKTEEFSRKRSLGNQIRHQNVQTQNFLYFINK